MREIRGSYDFASDMKPGSIDDVIVLTPESEPNEVEKTWTDHSIEFNKSYFREMSIGAELFSTSSVTVITTDLSSLDNADYIDRIKRARNLRGIYIIFNSKNVYVGQTSRPISTRLREHIKDSLKRGKKEDLFKEGKVFFFGRRDNRLGKDQLDEMERRLIIALKNKKRNSFNNDNGNMSFCTEEHKVIADYILEEISRIATISEINPFIECEDYQSHKIDIDRSVNYFAKMDHMKFVQYEWPEKGKIRKAVDNRENSNSFYREDRDSCWPTDPDKVAAFEMSLWNNYIKKK